ncbi:hypothetical protein SNEBB_002093 [Seison nebaliae]|nr:hypothetical protein SNEBB_002093 [Seison nebaliae]
MDLDDQFYENNLFIRTVKRLEATAQISRIQIMAVLFLFTTIYTANGYGNEIICNFCCFVYPFYATLDSIKRSRGEDAAQWLLYWLFFLTTYCLEELFFCISDYHYCYGHLYWMGKFILALWLMLPAPWNGATVFYQQFLFKQDQ